MFIQIGLFFSTLSLILLIYSYHIKKSLLRIFSFLSLYISVFLSALLAKELFISSSDFRNNIYTLKYTFNIDLQLIKPLLQLLSIYFKEANLLIALWTFVPCLVSWYIVVISKTWGYYIFKNDFINFLLSLLFSFVGLIFHTKGFFNTLPKYAVETIPTAHLLMQSVGVSLLLPFVYYYHRLNIIATISCIFSIMFHPVNALYITLSSYKIWGLLRRIKIFKRDKLFGISLFLWFLLIPLLAISPEFLGILYSFYVSFRGRNITGFQSIDMGISSYDFIIYSVLLVLFTSFMYALAIKLMNRMSHQIVAKYNFTFYVKKLLLQTGGFAKLMLLSIITILISLSVCRLSPDLSYRLLYIIYILSPVFVSFCFYALLLVFQSKKNVFKP